MNTKNIRYLLRFIPDKIYLQICYYLKLKKRLNLENPQHFNEKIQWLKLYSRNPEYTMMVDKYRVREYVKKVCSNEVKLIPLIGGPWKNVEDINIDELPNQFVLKCNHDSGSIVICKDKTTFDWQAAKQKLDYCVKHNFWYLGREWAYKNVKPCIIAEKYMVDESKAELKDYKVFNFNGKPQFIQLDIDRFISHKRNLYDTDWRLLRNTLEYPSGKNIYVERPALLDKMLEQAAKLSEKIPFLRTDFYIINDELYFGELTFYPGSGLEKFEPDDLGQKAGNWIRLPEKGEK